MYYLQSRYYDASVGRFINGDNPQISASFFTNYEFNLYTYCQNSPAFDVDLDGQISFSKVKKAIKDVVDNIKNVFKNIVNYIKKKFQEFISKVSCRFNNGYAYIPTTPIAILIDAIINTIVGFFKGLLTLSAIWTFATSEIVSPKDIALAVFISITQGVLLAGASVYVNQLYIQAKKTE